RRAVRYSLRREETRSRGCRPVEREPHCCGRVLPTVVQSELVRSMSFPVVHSRLTTVAVATVWLISAPTSTVVSAQWINVPKSKLPRTTAGEIDVSAPAPRLPDGTPDLTGPWSSKDNTLARDIAAGMSGHDLPYQPWARALFEQRKDGSHSRDDPDA